MIRDFTGEAVMPDGWTFLKMRVRRWYRVT